jgi:hypothetical protein
MCISSSVAGELGRPLTLISFRLSCEYLFFEDLAVVRPSLGSPSKALDVVPQHEFDASEERRTLQRMPSARPLTAQTFTFFSKLTGEAALGALTDGVE